jgi:hypothetical protein
MPNQILNISSKNNNILGQFIEDTVFVLCDTTIGDFSVTMPEGSLSRCHSVRFDNIGDNEVTINFNNSSLLYFTTSYVSTITIGAGSAMSLFNEPITGKWYSVRDPSIRWIWEDNRLKGQVYQDGAWHTCIKGGY